MIREIDTGSKIELMFEYLRRGKRLGAIHAVRKKISGRVRYVVRGVQVEPLFRRQGIATALYEAAAAEACRRRAPLASDERVGKNISRKFWDKQIRKGRAHILSKRGGYELGNRAPVFSLRCPPESLNG